MALPAVGDSSYPTPGEVRDAILRTLRVLCNRRGLTINVEPGSDAYIRADAFAARVAIAIANNKIALEDSSPLDATEDALEELAGIFGVTRRPAASATGTVKIVTTATVTIPADFRATAPNGKKYKTITAGTYANGASVELIAVDAGLDTDQDEGTKLTWDSASIGALNQVCTVEVGGLDGGADEDNDDRLRARLIRRLSFPAVGGNWSQVVGWAEESTSSVEAAYVYAAVRGPASYDVAITKAGGDRTLNSTTINAVRAYILAQMPGQNDLNLTSVTAQYVDVILKATLPLPVNAGGAGGGWRDAAPWPAENAKITAYNVGTGIATVNSTTAPTVGANIGIWDYAGETMREYTIVGPIGGGAGAWTFGVQNGFGFTPTNAYVSAGAVNLVGYTEAAMEAFAELGPGQKTTNVDIIPRGRRQPGPDVQAPTDLTIQQRRAVIEQYDEILDLEYANTYDTGTTNTRTSPSVPSTTADPPNILVVRHFAIRKA